MSPAEIVAYIGAAAWLPQIISWIYKIVSRPRLKLISSPTLELGYTTFGPIINLTCSISAERKDALIDKIELELEHEKGEKRRLTWSFLDEKQHEIRYYKGETAEISKNQPAIALKVPTIALAEKKIGFQDLEFQTNFKLHVNKLAELQSFLKKKNSSPVENLFVSKEFSDFVEFFKNQMYWKVGVYNLSVYIREVMLRHPYVERFCFTISNNEIERLQENCLELEKDVKMNLGVSAEESEHPKWNWVYPQVKATS